VVRRDTASLATSGDLDLLLDVGQLITSQTTDTFGYAVKRADDNRLTRGPVVTAIRSGSPQIAITGSNTYGAGDQFKHGELTIATTGIISREIYAGTTALNRAEEEVIYGTLGLGLPTVRDSSFRSKFVVPGSIDGLVTLSFRAWIMGHFPNANSLTVTTEQLTLSIKIVPRPNPSVNASLLTDTAITFPISQINNGLVFEQTSETFTASPGSIVYAELSRTPGNAAYEMHVLNHYLYVENVASGS
jgi:hypothetical protein